MRDHPENDLHSANDRFSRYRPEPETFDDLADQPDPLEVDRRNRRSTRDAIVWAAGTVAITLLTALVLGTVARLQGGPLCDGSGATWLCTTGWRKWWALATSLPPVAGLLGCAVIMVRKLNNYERWIPWMGVFWIPLVPFTMGWLILTIGMMATL